MSLPKLLLLIPFYRERDALLKCIDSAIASSAGVCELNVLVVANSPWDGTLLPDCVRLIQNDRNLGFGRGMNQGIREFLSGDGEFLLLSNQDIVYHPGCFSALFEAVRSDADAGVGIFSPIQLDENGALDQKARKALRPEWCDIVVDVVHGRTPRAYYETPYVNAACWLMRRKAVERVGGFDPAYVHYGEDIDYIRRLKKVGLGVAVVTRAHVLHTRVFAQGHDRETSRYIARNLVRATAIDHFRYAESASAGFSSCVKYLGTQMLLGKLGFVEGIQLLRTILKMRSALTSGAIRVDP